MAEHLDADHVASPMAQLQLRLDRGHYEQLRRRLRWQLLTAYATPLLVLAVFFHYQYSATLREGIYNHLRSTAESQRNTVDLFLQERVANVRSALRTEGGRGPGGTRAMTTILAELQYESPTFADVGLFTADGKLVSYAGPYPSLVGKDYGAEPWFQATVSGERNHHISDVYLGFRAKPHFIIAVRRLVDGMTWILRATVDPEKFGVFVGSSHLMADAEAFIVNRHGERQTLSRQDDVAARSSQAPARSPTTVVEEVEVHGLSYLRATAWLTENDWALVVRVPTRKAYAQLRLARAVLVGIMLVALAVILAVVLRSTRKLVAKLEAADSAKQDLSLQLFNAAKLASVGEMAAGVAHEINNPLAIIYEEASMMLDSMDPQFGLEPEPEEFRERLEAIKEATLRGRAITRKLMAFSRKQDCEPEPTDINLLIERVLEVKRVDFSVSNIEVCREFAADLPVVMVNRNQIDQVILNLLNNARDAIDGGGRVTVRTAAVNGSVRIEVEDTGCGMPPEVLEKVFFPFFTTKGVGKGTGLGLSISYGIIKSLGGRIEVRSEVGVGTRFTVHVPIGSASPQTASRATARAEGGQLV